MWLYGFGLTVLTVLALVTMTVMNSQYQNRGSLSKGARSLVFLVYFSHIALVLYTVWYRLGPIPYNQWLGLIGGGTLALLGLWFFYRGLKDFGSYERTTGQKTNRLITSGIYSVTRNPQTGGWGLILLGIGIMSRSWATLVIFLWFAIFIHVFLVYVEEPFLASTYGEEYEEYREQTPRYL